MSSNLTRAGARTAPLLGRAAGGAAATDGAAAVVGVSSRRVGWLAVPLALAGLAVLTGAMASMLVTFPHDEGSAYYLAVANNLTGGRGLVVDALWSYGTPPLVLPRPAFELWQPLASLLAAATIFVLGNSMQAAQLGGILLGAALGPLAWAVARDAGPAVGVPAHRLPLLAAGSGVLATVCGPLLLARAVPDSALPFAVFGTLACWLMPRAVGGRPLVGLALGAALGLAYLSRHEAVWLGLVFLGLCMASGQLRLGRLVPIVAGGLFVVGPWLLRNLATFGTPLPGQALDNALLTYNEQIFAYVDQPSLSTFVAQGLPQLALNIGGGLAHNVGQELLLSALPVGVVGLIGVVLLPRRRQVWMSPLGVLLLGGLLILAVTSVLFPIATRWGTFQHAAGPLLVGLAVSAVVAADRLVAWVGRLRNWQHANAWLGPLALSAVAVAIAAFQVLTVAGQAAASQARIAALAAAVREQPEARAGDPPLLVTDHPIWLAGATGLPAAALPREPAESIVLLAEALDAGSVLVVLADASLDPRVRGGAAAACLTHRALPVGAPSGALILALAAECRR